MKAFRLAVSAFLFLVFLSFSLPVFSLSVYQWESCGAANQCATKGVADGLTETYQCHKSAVTGNWQWDKQTLLQIGGSESIESNKIISGVCSDNYDNNCNGFIDTADTADCKAPIVVISSIDGGTPAPYFDKTNDGKTSARMFVTDESDNDLISCRFYDVQSGYDVASGTACSFVSSFYRQCDFTSGAIQGPHTGYVGCIDTNANVQPYTDGVTDRTSKKIDWTSDWTAPSVSFTKPPDPTGAPYDAEIAISDTYAGVNKDTIKVYVSNDGGVTWIDKTSAWFAPIPGTCQNAGQVCTLTHTVGAGEAEAADGNHKLKVEATDNLGNVLTPPIYTYLVSSCNIQSVSISPSASCTRKLSACSVTPSADKACKSGNSFDVTVQYKGMNCPTAVAGTTAFDVQVDAKSVDGLCDIKSSGGDMAGMKISCQNPTASAGAQTCSGTWTLPSPVVPDCQQKTVSPTDSCIRKTDGTEVACKIGGLVGSSSMCKDDTDTISMSYDTGSVCTASATITATSLIAKDTTYGLAQCSFDWGDGTIVTKTCDAGTASDCGSKFSSAEKQHTYASGGLYNIKFSCTNLNSKSKSIPHDTGIDTVTPDIVSITAYKNPPPSDAISSGVWENDNSPYFTWTTASSLCGMGYYITTDGTEPTAASTSTVVNNYVNPSNFADGATTIKIKPKNSADGTGVWGTTRTFDLKVDTTKPTTSVRETSCVTGWCSITAIHLDCIDGSSSCLSTSYCTGSGCPPNTAYDVRGSITISSPTVLGYRSIDAPGNLETTKYSTINVDTTPPNTPSVTISGVMNGYINTPTQMAITWTSVTDQSPNSGISDYRYSIGEAPACTNVVGFTSAGIVTSKTVAGISLVEGKNYCAKVMAVNGAGLTNVGTSSNVQLDASGPSGINSLTIERTYGNYISNPFTVYSASLTDAVGINTGSCQYTVDGSTWAGATWNPALARCEKSGLPCVDGVSKNIMMKVSDLLGSTSQTVSSVTKICDAIPPELQFFVPAKATTSTTSTKDATFSTTARDLKSGLAKLEWTLYKNGIAISDPIQNNCDGAPDGGSMTCNMKVSDFKLGAVNINPTTLKTGDKLFVRVRADDHIDPWSPTDDSGQWLIDESAPTISTITPTVVALGEEKTYSANVKAVTGKTISSCDLLVNGVKVDGMSLASGTNTDGTWTGEYTINTPATTFMRAHCVDNENSVGDGLDVQISLASAITTGLNLPLNRPPVFPAPTVAVEKLQMTNITAKYNLAGGSVISGGKCWVSSSDFNDPSKGIVGAALTDLNNGYYTYLFTAPAITGNYNYAISCSKQGYQISSGGNSFTVLGCDGLVCVKVTPKETAEVLKLGETRTLNLLLKNRDDFTRTYSISLASADPRVSVEIAPLQVTLANGEEKTVTLGLTSLLITDQLIVQNIIVKNVDPSKSADVATSAINISVAVGVVSEIGAVEVGLIFVLATLALYSKTGFRVNKRRK